MWFGIVTLFPELIADAAAHGVFGRAVASGGITLETFNPRTFTTDKHQTVDDKPYGGGAGMVMKVTPLLGAVRAAQDAARERDLAARVIYLSAQGRPFSQQRAAEMAASGLGYVLICGRYEGVDQRLIDLVVDEELSMGDFVLSGGEVPALAVMDAVARLCSGTLGNPESLDRESHLDGSLEYPQYTRPEMVEGLGVPPELLTGDHQSVASFQRARALERTYIRRPEMLLESGCLEQVEDRQLLAQQLKEDSTEETDRAQKQDH